jgi:hypothetical protein
MKPWSLPYFATGPEHKGSGMAKSISLTVHRVRIKAVNGPRNTFQLLDSFSDKSADLYEVLDGWLTVRKHDAYKSDDNQQALQVRKIETKKRQIEGLLNAGHFGRESEIRNLNKWRDVAYNKQKLDVDLQPFYFLFDLPEGKEQGFLISQTTGLDGVQTLLNKMIHEQCIEEFPDVRIRFNPVIPAELRKELEKSNVCEVVFIHHRVPRDIATMIGRSGTAQTTGKMRLSVRFEEDGVAPEAIRRFLDKKRGLDSTLELEGLEFPYEDVKIKVRMQGKERTMNLGAADKIRPSYEITDQVKISSAGHPTFESISAVAKDLLGDLKGAK